LLRRLRCFGKELEYFGHEEKRESCEKELQDASHEEKARACKKKLTEIEPDLATWGETRLGVEELKCDPHGLVQGPPGTGKTQTILGLLSTVLDRSRSYRQVPELSREEMFCNFVLASWWMTGNNIRNISMPVNGDDGTGESSSSGMEEILSPGTRESSSSGMGESSSSGREAWHDLHCKIDGPAAYDILTNFEEHWLRVAQPHGLHKLMSSHDEYLLKIDRIRGLCH
ncbi:hypothetical protein Droror1_Dr00015172, partial [Drosera rotundifolia]